MAFPPVPKAVSTNIITRPPARQARPGMTKKLTGVALRVAPETDIRSETIALSLGVSGPALERRADGHACRGRQRNRPVLVDALAVIDATLVSNAFNYLSLVWAAILGLRGMGRRTDSGPAGRFCDRCRLGPLYSVARDLTPPPD